MTERMFRYCQNGHRTNAERCPECVMANSPIRRQRDAQRQRDNKSASYADTSQWRNRTRPGILASNPLCAAIIDGRVCGQPATELHHLRPPENRPDLIFDWQNIRPLCVRCHAKRRAAGEPDEVLANLDAHFAPIKLPGWMTNGF